MIGLNKVATIQQKQDMMLTSVATVPCFFRAWVFRLLVFKAWASVQSFSVLSLSVPVKLYQSLNTKRPSQMQIQLVFSRFHTYTTHKVCFSCLFCSGEEENNQNNCLLMIVQPKDWKGLRTWRLKRTEGLKCTRTESSSPVQGLGDWGLVWTVATILPSQTSMSLAKSCGTRSYYVFRISHWE